MKTLIKTLLAMAFVASSFSLSAQNDSKDLIDKYKNEEGVSVLNFSGNFLSNFISEGKEELDNALSEVGAFRMLIFEDTDRATISDLRKDMKKYLKDGYNDLMKIKSDGTEVSLVLKEAKADAKGEIVMFIDDGESNEVVTFFIEGNFSKEDAKKLMEGISVDD